MDHGATGIRTPGKTLMATSKITAESLLAIDIGTTKTRTILFDVVDGQYHFIAAGSSETTARAPINDVSVGVRNALAHLQTITGRQFFDSNWNLIVPSTADGLGVDRISVTMSTGKPLTVVVAGLLDEVSVASARRLAAATYGKVVNSIGLNDRRKLDARIDTIIHARPDMVIIAGGTDDGASNSIQNLLEAVGLACHLLPRHERPEVLYAGNQALQEEVEVALSRFTNLSLAPNIRPELHAEHLESALPALSEIFRHIRSKESVGVAELNSWSGGRLMPSGTAFGRVIRFLSKVYDPVKGVLGVDIGASSSTVAAGFAGNLVLNVSPELGLGTSITGVLKYSHPEEISRWVRESITPDRLRDYIYNKSLHPASFPETQEELAIEQAVARKILQIGVRNASANFPGDVFSGRRDVLPWFEPVMASGGVLVNAPTAGQSMLMMLDGLQPAGVTTIVLDRNNLLAPLGAAAEVNQVLVVQALETSAFLHLGTVIAPVGNARPGTPVLKVRATMDDGSESDHEVKFGTIEVIRVPTGQTANLHLQPLQRFDVGMGGPGHGGTLRGVTGGSIGVVIDARGRPIQLSEDPARRVELHNKWQWVLDG